MSGAGFRDVDESTAARANRHDWDAEADDYLREHGRFLRDAGFVWCPEGVDEADVRWLGEVRGLRVLELGCGAAQCARWLAAEGAEVIGLDLSVRMLQHSRRIDLETSSVVPVVCATATALPLADGSVDLVCSAFGALPFVVDIDQALREVARVLRPGGRCVFTVVHPVRRMFADDPTEAGLRVRRSYFDRSAYVETEAAGRVTYVEPHHTLEDWVRALLGAGLQIVALREPEWPEGHDRVWGGWGPLRGALVPGTLALDVRRSPGPAE
ncbi:MAG: class I SAM-dependent methyltransferase [Nocardioidaceae bacterium]